ncbi:hypothetical protein [Delftia sp. PS-11]|uniref:hypothetical protein n=1 Tax=Delftia sp. PS-11 TaxID=2767222 RepID=UPI0024582E13|nr:hypothetical protein [Delftia sp. PS-11]KAJ8741812.1 hypothetical protein H9T68_20840 [Delftia sp. PS-11]
MRKIEISTIDANLLADISGDIAGWELFEAASSEFDGVWQVLWSEEAGRAGLVYVGNGSDGATLWTDAASPEDAFSKLQADELSA